MGIRIGFEGHRYRWIDDWADLPDDERLVTSWAHNALCLTREGNIVGFHPANSNILVFAPDGSILRSFDCGLVEGHGLTLVVEDDAEYLWVADNGMRPVHNPDSPFGYELFVPNSVGMTTITLPDGEELETPLPHGRVIKIRLSDGAVVAELPEPPDDNYAEGAYIPTAVAVAPDGTTWVADGYGASLLHHFARDGRLLRTITGEESGAGRLNCPHGLLIDERRGETELYVADRENNRLVVFDMEGAFRREVAKGELVRPSALTTSGDMLVVAELRARITLLDANDRVLGHLGDNEAVADLAEWPNALADGKPVRPAFTPGKFNSPHGLASDGQGNLYVTDWVIGGRYTKLEPLS